MQVIHWINQLNSRVTAAVRQRQSERLSAALSRELVLADPRMRADIQQLIGQATSTETPAAATCDSKASSPMAAPARPAGGFQATPLPGLPTHIRYSTS